MKRDNVNYLVVGCVVLAGLTLMLYTLYRLTGGVGESDGYYTDYVSVSGLSEGTPVTYQGYKLGTVSGIAPLKKQGKTYYRVSIVIRDGWKIPSDSIARIYSEGLLAETVINIEEGSSDQFLTPGSEIMGRQGADVFKAINSIAGDVGDLINHSVKPLIDNLNTRLLTMGGQLDSSVPQILEDATSLMKSLQEGADRIPRILNQDLENKVGRVVDNADAMVVDLRQLSQGLLQTRKSLDQLLNQSKGTVSNMGELLTETKGTVTDNRKDLRKSVLALRNSLDLIADYTETILHNLEGSTRHMNEFSREIRDNPGLLLGGKPPKEVGSRQ